MKSQRRHELQTNMLADWLGETLGRIKPYQNAILATVILVVVVVLGFMWWRNRSASFGADAWASVRLVNDDPQAYEDVAQRFPKTPAGEWSAILAADQYLLIGSIQLFHNKAMAVQALGRAEGLYQKALQEGSTPMAQERATFGLARTLECAGRLDDAVKRYQEVVDRWPTGMFRATAEDRIRDLGKESIKRFYDDFAKFNPKPPPAKETGAGSKSKLGPPPENPPEVPAAPTKPEAPAKPQVPGKAEVPAKAEIPAKPVAPAKAEVPAKPEVPAKAEVPAKSPLPGKAAAPDEPAAPQKPEPPAKGR
jgi:tetratricopeptide (TPR) repeat protein